MIKTKSTKAFTKLDDDKRYVKQFVSVFGNVDHGGDKVHMGAFAKTIERWEKSPEQLPVIFSHQWSDPMAMIGDVKEAEEVPPGDKRLPDEIKENGGWLVGWEPDTTEKAEKVYSDIKKGRLTQSSYAYDIREGGQEYDKKGNFNNLYDLDVFEVGPTLRGMNSATTLLSAKSLFEIKEALGANSHHPFMPSKEDAGICAYPDCGRGKRTNVHIERFASQEHPDHLKQLLTTISELTLNLKAIVELYGEDITKLSKADEQVTVKADDETKSDSKSEEKFTVTRAYQDLVTLL